jgi:hypothetical protein
MLSSFVLLEKIETVAGDGDRFLLRVGARAPA